MRLHGGLFRTRRLYVYRFSVTIPSTSPSLKLFSGSRFSSVAEIDPFI